MRYFDSGFNLFGAEYEILINYICIQPCKFNKGNAGTNEEKVFYCNKNEKINILATLLKLHSYFSRRNYMYSN